MTAARQRLTSLAVVAFFCLLCAGTSKPSGGPPPPLAIGGGPATPPGPASTGPDYMGHNTPVKGRIDPFDKKLPDGASHYDAYIINLKRNTTYQARVQPGAGSKAKADAGTLLPDGGIDAIANLWFEVRVYEGKNLDPKQALGVDRKVLPTGSTMTKFTPASDGEHLVVVLAYFGNEQKHQPGYSTYELRVLKFTE